MGYYIETPASHGKAAYLCAEHQGLLIPKPNSFAEIPANEALIVVVDNYRFEAAGLAFNEREFQAFTDPGDPRPKQYVLLNKALAYKLSGYPESA